jgi:hypothetical protein
VGAADVEIIFNFNLTPDVQMYVFDFVVSVDDDDDFCVQTL